MEHVSHAVAQRTTRKAEDVASAEIRPRVGTFAVFDGHGGKAAAAACDERPIPSLLDLAMHTGNVFQPSAHVAISLELIWGPVFGHFPEKC